MYEEEFRRENGEGQLDSKVETKLKRNPGNRFQHAGSSLRSSDLPPIHSSMNLQTVTMTFTNEKNVPADIALGTLQTLVGHMNSSLGTMGNVGGGDRYRDGNFGTEPFFQGSEPSKQHAFANRTNQSVRAEQHPMAGGFQSQEKNFVSLEHRMAVQAAFRHSSTAHGGLHPTTLQNAAGDFQGP